MQVQQQAEQHKAELEAQKIALETQQLQLTLVAQWKQQFTLEAQQKQQQITLDTKMKAADIQAGLEAAIIKDSILEEEEEVSSPISSFDQRLKNHYNIDNSELCPQDNRWCNTKDLRRRRVKARPQ